MPLTSVGSIGLETLHAALVDRLQATTSLTRSEVVRVVGDVLDYFAEQTPDLVRRRHRELSAQHLTNPAIFDRIRDELPLHRVAVPQLSVRQLRRAVYG